MSLKYTALTLICLVKLVYIQLPISIPIPERPYSLDDTDIHLSTCPGYSSDIVNVNGQLDYYSFWDIDTLEDIEKLKILAKIVLLMLERMKHVQKFDSIPCVGDGDLSGRNV